MDGLDLTTIGTGAGGMGLAGLALAALLRVLPGVVAAIGRAIAGAITRVSEALARARERRADAVYEEARAKTLAVDAQAAETVKEAAALQKLWDAIDRAEKRAEAAESEARALRQWCMRAAGVMRQAGITPPEFPAAMVGEEA